MEFKKSQLTYENTDTKTKVQNNWRIPKKKSDESYSNEYDKQKYSNNSTNPSWRTKKEKLNEKQKLLTTNFNTPKKKNNLNKNNQQKFISATTLCTEEIKQIKPENLSPQDLKILFEEPLNTTNPLKAVYGYIPKDDVEICRHSVNGECFKKSKCKLRHENKIAEGWTRDQTSVIISTCNEPIYPGVNTHFEVIPTFIENCCDKFYGQIISSELEQFYQLMNTINAPEQIFIYKSFIDNNIPTLGELVLGKFSDGLFYRGQITDYDESIKSVGVFFVDYGNTSFIPLEDVRKWERKFETVSFQAIPFSFSGIKCKLGKENDLKCLLDDIFLNNVYKAFAVSSFDCTYIKIYHDGDLNLIDDLINLGYCESNYSFQPVFDQQLQRIPG